MATITIIGFEGEDGQAYFQLRAENGEPVAQSEGYVNPEHRDETMDLIANATFVVQR